MMKAITKKFIDKSTDEFFKFSFYCDRCGFEWESCTYYFEHGFSNELTEGERRAKNIMWRVEHDIAFERANLEARLKFNHCVKCGKIVCDECYAFDEEEDLCVDCARRNASLKRESKMK